MGLQILHDAIQSSLTLYDLNSASFLSEVLVASCPSLKNTHLFGVNLITKARVLYMKGELHHAISILDPTANHFKTLFLYGLLCFDLHRYLEAESVMKRCVKLEATLQELSAAWCLLGMIVVSSIILFIFLFLIIGRICKAVNRIDQSITAFNSSLKFDALNWTAFHELSNLGIEVDAEKIFNVSRVNIKVKEDVIY
jgi:tetratricopeptide (TPR) repeat protein